MGGQGSRMSTPCLESQGCHLTAIFYLPSCSSEWSLYSCCHHFRMVIVFLLSSLQNGHCTLAVVTSEWSLYSCCRHFRMVIVLLLSSLQNGHCTFAVVTLFRYRPILLPGFQKCLQLTFQKVGFFEGHFFLWFFRALRGGGDVR